jgi:type II secretory pathway predicted ATPase ExeA
MPSRSLLSFWAPYLRPTIRSAPLNRSAEDSRPAANPAARSGLLLSTGLAYSPRDRALSETESNPGKRVGARLEFPSLPSAADATGNLLLPFDAVVSQGPDETLEVSASSESKRNEEDFPALPSSGELARIREKIVFEISAALDFQVEEQTARETTASSHVNDTEVNAIGDVAPAAPLLSVPGEDEPKWQNNLLSHFGLQEQPFDVAPDPAYLYSNSSHREALASLKQGIEYSRGFMMLVAEPGMGKTTLLNRLMEELSNSARVVFLFQTQCTSHELLCYILNELEVDHAGMDSVAMHRALNQALFEEMLRGRRFVLIVDEAQNLDAPVLETIRLLSNFETAHSKLIQVVLAGQPQLADTLMKPGLVQLRQRIAALSSLKPLDATEIAEYVEHRLRVSGRIGQPLFTSEAIAGLAEASGGVPRSINNLCFNALVAAYERGLETIGAEIVKEVSAKLDFAAVVRSAEANASLQTPGVLTVSAPAVPEVHTPAASTAADDATAVKVSESPAEAKPKPEAILTGTLTEKVRSQSWSKRPEYRILISFERDRLTGLPVADRYYCCSLYVDETNAAALQTGKPARIKIEQD